MIPPDSIFPQMKFLGRSRAKAGAPFVPPASPVFALSGTFAGGVNYTLFSKTKFRIRRLGVNFEESSNPKFSVCKWVYENLEGGESRTFLPLPRHPDAPHRHSRKITARPVDPDWDLPGGRGAVELTAIIFQTTHTRETGGP